MSLRATIGILAADPTARVVDLAVAAESRGFSRCWLYDEGLATRDVYVTLAAIAQRTTTITLGTGITNPYTRHPGTTADAIATLDELSGGRVFVGVGAGGSLALGPLALARRRPARAIEEMVVTMRRLFAGEIVDVDGDTLTYSGARIAWGRPDIEIWVAGRGPRILELGGRLADGVLLSYIHKDLLAGTSDRIRAVGSGRTRPVRFCYATSLVTSEAAFEHARSQLSFRIADSPPEVLGLLGVTDAELGALRAALADGGPDRASRHVRSEWVDRFALVGNPGEIAADLARMAERSNIDEFQVAVQDVATGHDQIAEAKAILDQT